MKEIEKMKCIWYSTQKPKRERLENYLKVAQRIEKAMEEHPDEFPKIGPAIRTGGPDGFRFVEGTYEQLQNLVAAWSPVDESKLVVYFECPPYYEIAERWRSYE